MAFTTEPPAPKAIAGHYHTVDPNYGSPPSKGSKNHVFVPCQSMSSSESQFSLYFLTGGTDGGWKIADSRGSLLLLYRGVKLPNVFNANTEAESCHKPGFVVCEPLTRQYKQVPCRPQDLDLEGHRCLGLFLLRGDRTNRWFCGGGGGGISLSNFKVMAALHRPHSCSSGRGVPAACVFSMGSDAMSGAGAWSSRSFFSVGSDWHMVKRAWGSEDHEIVIPSSVESFYFAGRAYGSLYWGIQGTGAALVLDEATPAFSTVTLPEAILGSHGRRSFRVVGGGGQDDGVMRIVRLVGNDLKVFARIHGSDDKWVVERLVRLREATRVLPGCQDDGYFLDEDEEAIIVDAQDTYVLLTPRDKTWLFAVVVLDGTMAVDREHERNKYAGPACPWKLPPVQKLWPPIARLLSCIPWELVIS